jgi:hypothetical protein
MEPFSTVILLASLAGMPATMGRSWAIEKKERSPTDSSTHHLIIGSDKTSTERTFTVGNRGVQIFEKAVNAQLDGYGSLRNGWDGEGSLAPSGKDISRAIAFVDSLPSAIPLPKPMVSADGQIGLYWNREDKYADINFDFDDTISIYVRDSTYNPPVESYLEGVSSVDKAEQWVPMLLGLFAPMRVAA